MRDIIECECQGRDGSMPTSMGAPTPSCRTSATAVSVNPRITRWQLDHKGGGSGVESCVLYCEDRGIATITLNRPKVKNAISEVMYLRLCELLQRAAESESIVAVILTGSRGFFTSGADLKELLSTRDRKEALDAPQSSTTKPVGRFMFALLSFPKFIVAAVNGPAVGIGVTMLPHCDVAYAYESSGGIDDTRKGNVESSTATHTVAAEAGSATFWTPFFRLSIVPEFGSSVTLPEILIIEEKRFILRIEAFADGGTCVIWLGQKFHCAEAAERFRKKRGIRCAVAPLYGMLAVTSSLVSGRAGWSLANDMLVMGRKLSAEEALSGGLVSRVITAGTEEAFLSKVQDDVRRSVVGQHMAAESSMTFKRIMRNSRRSIIQKVCTEELTELDRRMQAGHPHAALAHLARHPASGRSKL